MERHPFQDGSDLFAQARAAQAAAMDQMRGAQARSLDLLGFGTHECAYDVVGAGPHWRLRRYHGAAAGAPLFLVPAPIKRPYIWDLTPDVSVVRFWLDHGLSVHLLEWIAPTDADEPAGIEDYARAILAAGGAIRDVRAEGHGNGHGPHEPDAHGHDAHEPDGAPAPLFLIGHSLGGTLAAIACAMEPDLARGVVLLGAPLSFEPGSSAFRDLVVAQHHDTPEDRPVPGSQLSQGCAMLSPVAFVWARWMDIALSLTDPTALNVHLHVTRWALDEVALPGKLIRQMVDWLYREDRFRLGRLALGAHVLGPADLTTPVLAVITPADEIGPRAAVEPFFARISGGDTQILEHPAEIGVGLQHLAILAGRRAHAQTWPQIAGWMAARR
ncbi:alpha/beta hydrolase [Ancylobacter amanitiformis]|uniref:Polyhydroxyalkanoate synthase n=1 Tax=Ancylobacter amanitiformis TaxID=217069 RepID=A0ABU0LMA9_9HYPH|nr:alpha/beta hydrolase [Ancylobacter amanitiformis]MDQ0509839.1 polyhydroxyalkanoate synthase [Ancylobacter amanitiformis]